MAYRVIIWLLLDGVVKISFGPHILASLVVSLSISLVQAS